jgi:hypothetical protein
MLLEPTSDARVTPMVSEVVVPVLNADKILETPTVSLTVAGDLSITAGTYVPYFTVPQGEEWALISAKKSPTSVNTRVIIQITGNNLEVLTDGTSAAIVNLRDYILRENDSVGLRATGDGGDSARNLTIGYSKISLEE